MIEDPQTQALTSVLQQLNADTIRVDQIKDEWLRAQGRSVIEQQYLTAVHTVLHGTECG